MPLTDRESSKCRRDYWQHKQEQDESYSSARYILDDDGEFSSFGKLPSIPESSLVEVLGHGKNGGVWL